MALLGSVVLVSAGVIFGVSRWGTPEQSMSIAPLIDRAIEVKSAVDRVGMNATRLSLKEEIQLGDELMNRERTMGFPLPGGHLKADQAYVESVLSRLVRFAHLKRPGMPYQVQVVDHPAINAFALPGGHLIITTGMLAFLQNESELAAVLGHEMSHVDMRHCVERYQYQVQARKLGGAPLAAMASLGAALMLQGYQDEQEAEADRRGMNFATQAGYHPDSARVVFLRMEARQGQKGPLTTIPSEVHTMVLDGMQDVFASHPSYGRRIRELSRGAREDGLDPLPTPAYLGTQNYKLRMSRDQGEIPTEFTQLELP